MRYLLDTNVLSEPARTRPHPGVMAALARQEHLVCTAAPVVHELIYGVQRLPEGRRRGLLEAYVKALLTASLPVLPYD